MKRKEKARNYSYTTAEELADMAANMRGIAAAECCTTSLRPRLFNAADCIDAFLVGQLPMAKRAMEHAIRDVQADIEIEAQRHEKLEGLHACLYQARTDEDPHAWRDAMMQLLPIMSDSQIMNLAQLVDAYDQVLGSFNEARFLSEMPLNTNWHEEQSQEVVFIHGMPEGRQ